MGWLLPDPYGTNDALHRTDRVLACLCTLGAELGHMSSVFSGVLSGLSPKRKPGDFPLRAPKARPSAKARSKRMTLAREFAREFLLTLRYGSANALFSLSEVGFDRAHQHAIISYRLAAGRSSARPEAQLSNSRPTE